MKKVKKERLKPADNAFVNSDKDTLGDLKLFGWSPERMMKAQELGMKHPNLSADDKAQFKQANIYPGAVMDASIFVLLSSLPDKDKFDRDGNLVTASFDSVTREQARAFGVKRGFHDTTGLSFWQAFEKYFATYNDIQRSATKPKSTPGDGKTDDDEFPN